MSELPKDISTVFFKVARIIEGTSVDGPGLRTSIYFSGCNHHCKDCHNPDIWSLEAGETMSLKQIMEVVVKNDFNVTFSGGDPLLQMPSLLTLAREIKNIGKNIWCYTGYTYDEIYREKGLKDILTTIDVLVDGKFDQNQKEPSLLFRGSKNQRLIDCNKTLLTDNIILWESEE